MRKPSRKKSVAYLSIIAVLLVVATVSWVGYVRAGGEQQRITAATVKITSISNTPDYSKPWQSKENQTSLASGAIISGEQILTNAHAIVNAVSIEVRRPGLQKSFLAHVKQVDHSCDLALLSVEDPAFFRGVEPLRIGSLATIGSVVSAYGYPEGGDAVSATSGVVSRLEESTYAHSQRELLLAQIDAALNPGNSGGPVISDGKIVGIAMQTLQDAENVGYMVPVPMINRFLTDAADGEIAGVPTLGAFYTSVENEALRQYLGLKEEQGGTIVADVGYGSSAWGKLHADDVILAIDGVPVASDCTVSLAGDTRVECGYLIEQRQVGDAVTLRVWRDRRTVEVPLTLSRSDFLVPLPAYEARCAYRVFGGLVFQPANTSFVEARVSQAPSSVCHAAISQAYRTEATRELVVMTSVLPHRLNRGYQDWSMEVVDSVQGQHVRDFAQFNELIDAASGRWLNITFEDKLHLVLDLAAARKANDEILNAFAIAQDRWPHDSGSAVAVVRGKTK